MSQSQGDRRRAPARVALTWEAVPQPLRILVYLLMALLAIQIYHDANFLVSRIFNVVLLFVFAGIIALLLTPVIDRVEHSRLIHGRRGLAVLIVNAVILLVVAGGIALLVPIVGQQFNAFQDEAPRLYGRAAAFLAGFQGDLARVGINVDLRKSGTGGFGGQLFDNAFRAAQGAVSAAISVLLVVVISIYLEAQGRELVASIRRLFDEHQEQVDFFFVASGTTVAAYVRGQLLLALLMSVYMGVALTIAGVHYSFVIAIAVFFLEFLPLIGAPVGMALAALFALFQSPTLGLIALGIGLGGHALEAYIIGPRISGKATRLHPLAAMVALLIGADVSGLLGALFAVPIAGIINVYLGAMYMASKGEEDAFALPEHRDATIEDLPRLGEQISEVNDQGLEAEPLPHATADRPPKRR
ncbi:MAG: AI-2E family transporter, partial [Candidatus Dormibacteria bacterium]